MKLTRIAFLAALSAMASGQLAHGQDLPEGQGKAVLQTACTQCHGVDVIMRQPRSRDEWMEVVARMVGSGAQLSDDDYNTVIEYLAAHLGPASQTPPATGRSSAAAAQLGKREK